jgi:sugar diacid utilization regulator
MPTFTADADALAELAIRMAGPDALAADISERHVVLAVEPVDDARVHRALDGQSPGALVAVGFRVAIADIAESYRWAHRACLMRARGLLGTDTVVHCDEYAVPLLADAERVLHEQLVATRLAPLAPMSLAKRLKYGRLLSALLELGSTRGDAPGVLDKHRQTLRYQVSRLEQLFGDQLADREARVELILALRTALPLWEQEDQRAIADTSRVPQPPTTGEEPR